MRDYGRYDDEELDDYEPRRRSILDAVESVAKQDIGDDDGGLHRRRSAKGMLRVSSFDDVVARQGQHRRIHLAAVGIVVNEEHER